MIFLVVSDLLEQVSIVSVLHDDAELLVKGKYFLPEGGRRLVNEGFLVGDDVSVVDGCENPHFVQSVFFLLIRQLLHPYFLQCVVFIVCPTSYVVYTAVSTLPYH